MAEKMEVLLGGAGLECADPPPVMNSRPRLRLLPLVASVLGATSLFASEPVSIRVEAGTPGARINPAMWGLFFEDINFGADGGLNAELVKNGSFEFPDPRMGWKRVGGEDEVLFLARADATPANRRLVRIHSTDTKAAGLRNEGFRGIGVRGGEACVLTLEARVLAGSPGIRAELVGPQGVLAAAEAKPAGGGAWSRVELALTPSATEAKASLVVTLLGAGEAELDRVSLFPSKTWKGRPQGLRADMVQMLADMKPGFLRFPGGCIVEGSNLELRYQWKKTILPREERELLLNRWNVEFKDRAAPDYYQSFALGFYEYFVLCEDIGAEPLPIINCGMSCQYNTGEMAPLDGLQPYVQDALDLIEFANGPVTSTWGAKRAALGHPAPFGLKMRGVGNEQWGPHYVERYAVFAKALAAAHPDVALVAAAGPAPGDARFDALWKAWRAASPAPAFVDEHSYSSPAWFHEQFSRYDKYPRTGPQVMMGEYACHTKERKNNLESALAEAVFMLGMERNADVVRLAAYAPLFAHVDAWQWKPDMIWVDNLRVMPTPNYHVQRLFATNRGDVVVPVAVTLPEPRTKLYASAVKDEKAGELILKVVNAEATPVRAALVLEGAVAARGKVKALVLTAASPAEENTLDQPDKVTPVASELEGLGAEQTFAPHSLTVLRVRVGR